MADVTSPFAFPYPEETDLVRDGATDIENLATGVNDYLAGGYLYAGTRYYTSSGTFAKADPLLTGEIGLRAIRVRAVGGGAGGGSWNSTNAHGPGGSGGGYAESFITNIAGLDTSVTVTRGGGGAGAAFGGAGTNGTASSFGAAVIGDGGEGGQAGAGRGGRSQGGTGDLVITSQSASGGGAGGTGAGGGSHLGGGGASQGVQNATANGTAGGLYGGGGSGSWIASTGTPTGGAGANGIVIVDCFV